MRHSQLLRLTKNKRAQQLVLNLFNDGRRTITLHQIRYETFVGKYRNLDYLKTYTPWNLRKSGALVRVARGVYQLGHRS